MLCKVRPRSLMAFAVLSIVLLATLTEVASAAKGRNNKRKAERPRLRRTAKYLLDLENVKMLAHSLSHNWASINANFRNRSLSPWIYKKDTDSNRYPSSIFKAECVSTHCLNGRGLEDPSLNTRLIIQEMIVLRRKEGSDHKIIYRAEKLMVPVACICVHPEVVRGPNKG